MKNLHSALPVILSLSALFAMAPVNAQEHWVSTWTASPQPIWGHELPLPTLIPETLTDSTVHQQLRISSAGDRMRVVISNEYGQQPLLIGAARLKRVEESNAGQPLTFNGQTQLRIAPGEKRTSDPIDLHVPALAELLVSLYLPQRTPLSTFHWDGKQTAVISPGNQTQAIQLKGNSEVEARLFLSEVLVDAAPETRGVVVLGDSLTDGRGSTLNGNRRWTDFLAQRLSTQPVAVLNAGISGARLLDDGMGESAAKRFERDVLRQPGVSSVVLMLGINDISWPGSTFAPNTPIPTLETLIAGYQRLIAQARQHKVRIIGTTLMPFEDALQGTLIEHYYSAEKDQLCQALNRWIRSSGAFDAVIDFDRIMRDPQHPTRFLPKYDSGDHLHPGDFGNQAMAEAVDLEVLF
ncbi:lipase [Pseudomonas brassicacearum]|uniref:Lipase n=1 Tax=Pseudomonas brassicacearum TaxID=930166 RepID=A0A423HA51_9PSED|nr:SGNH/GDSL hydrolase family protein [Pseudomonas brassicacearum]RON10052.1 lipase [Pseudomonas brassicacearum]